MEKIILLSGVVMVKPCPNTVDTWYSVKERRVGFKWKKELVITKNNIFSKEHYAIDGFQADNRYYDAINKRVMYMPHCNLYLANQSVQTKFFNTVEELTVFVDFIKSNNITICIDEKS